MATMIISACIESFGLDLDDFAVNVFSIRKAREAFRNQISSSIKLDLMEKLEFCHTLHFDGKKLKDTQTGKFKEIVPILLTGQEQDLLLGAPEVPSGTGEDIAMKIFDVLMKWDCEDAIKAVSADTTSVNTGWEHGVIATLEELLQKQVMYLACQHHNCEVVLKAIFEHLVSPSSGPEISLFVRCKEAWNAIDQNNFTPGIHDPIVVGKLQGKANEIIEFANQQLQDYHRRADYKELLELCVTYLGGIPANEAKFYQPGAVSDARFMGKAIYCLKIDLLRSQFKLSKKQSEGIRDFCIFVVRFYVKLWFKSLVASAAPNNTLSFLRDVISYSEVNPIIVDLVFKKFSNHLWYLSQDCVSLGFFDPDIPPQMKREMVAALSCKSRNEWKKRFEASPEKLKCLTSRGLDFFVIERSALFFERFSIDRDFMTIDPTEWEKHPSYVKEQKIVSSIQVTNDVAERAVSLMQDYSGILTKDEDQRENIMLIVEEHRRLFPNVNKTTLRNNFVDP